MSEAYRAVAQERARIVAALGTRLRNDPFASAFNAGIQEAIGIVLSGDVPETVIPDSPGEMAAVLADDAREWPEGHPCRQCGAFYRQHPNAVAACESWS